MTENTGSLFTEESQMVAELSTQIVYRYHHNVITREHILLAFFETSIPAISRLFEYLKVDVAKIRNRLQYLVSHRLPTPPAPPDKLYLDVSAKRFIENSRIETDKLGEKLISSQTLLLALIQSYFSGPHEDITMQRILTEFKLSPETVRKALLTKQFWEK